MLAFCVCIIMRVNAGWEDLRGASEREKREQTEKRAHRRGRDTAGSKKRNTKEIGDDVAHTVCVKTESEGISKGSDICHENSTHPG